MKFYIAGPYSADTEAQKYENTLHAIDAGLLVWKKGHYPYIPHLTHFLDSRAKQKGIPMRWKEYLKWHEVWLKNCDALLYLGSSRGADQELEYAKTLGKIIFYNVEDIPIINRNK